MILTYNCKKRESKQKTNVQFYISKQNAYNKKNFLNCELYIKVKINVGIQKTIYRYKIYIDIKNIYTYIFKKNIYINIIETYIYSIVSM